MHIFNSKNDLIHYCRASNISICIQKMIQFIANLSIFMVKEQEIKTFLLEHGVGRPGCGRGGAGRGRAGWTWRIRALAMACVGAEQCEREDHADLMFPCVRRHT
jgi:hypothetical protein